MNNTMTLKQIDIFPKRYRNFLRKNYKRLSDISPRGSYESLISRLKSGLFFAGINAKGNGGRRVNSYWLGRIVKVKENNPQCNDIPSFEHGFVHIYDESDNYLGFCGFLLFAEIIGIKKLDY